ncbi:hypothetical protein BDN67DRAFT_969335, partial [Paxillus ammoniavirescens]
MYDINPSGEKKNGANPSLRRREGQGYDVKSREVEKPSRGVGFWEVREMPVERAESKAIGGGTG